MGRRIKKSYVKVNLINTLKNQEQLSEGLAKWTPALLYLLFTFLVIHKEMMPECRVGHWSKGDRCYFHTQQSWRGNLPCCLQLSTEHMTCSLVPNMVMSLVYRANTKCSRVCLKQRDYGSAAQSFYLRIILEISFFFMLFVCALLIILFCSGLNCDLGGSKH